MKKTSSTCTSFAELKSALEKKGYKPSQTCAQRVSHSPDPESDREFFRKAMADVREIREFRDITVQRPGRAMLLRKTRDDASELLEQVVSGKSRMCIADTGEYVEWTKPGIKTSLVKRLHRGDFAVQDSLDLHGMTLPEAEEAVYCFLLSALRRNFGCVKVIHGRGLRSPKGPVLKKALMEWLQRHFRKWVLAYATAKDCDGGLGATYIVLKSR